MATKRTAEQDENNNLLKRNREEEIQQSPTSPPSSPPELEEEEKDAPSRPPLSSAPETDNENMAVQVVNISPVFHAGPVPPGVDKEQAKEALRRALKNSMVEGGVCPMCCQYLHHAKALQNATVSVTTVELNKNAALVSERIKEKKVLT